MFSNQISDISSLSNLLELESIKLSYNSIQDIKYLVDNSGIGNGDEIWIDNNPLSDTSRDTYIPQLEASGVTVHQ